jgi:hypothetical protein
MLFMRFGIGLVALALLAFAAPAGARGVRCEDIAREQSRGKPVPEVVESLGTTRTRVAACSQLAAERERQARRQARLRARQALRRGAVE